MKTLLVEDTVQLSKALSTVLRRNGHVVDCAFDGEEALEFIRQYDYDVIILDVMMPKKDGFEVLSIMREEGNATPVIMLTARSSVDDKIQGLDLGADRLTKYAKLFGYLLADGMSTTTEFSTDCYNGIHKITFPSQRLLPHLMSVSIF